MLHTPTIPRMTILTLTALTVAFTLLLVTACSGNDATPPSQPDPTQDALLKEISRQSSKIDNLQRTVEKLQSSTSQDTVPPTPTHAPPTKQPPPTPTVAAPTGPGICGRTPRVQQAILAALHTNSCRTVTDEELYRITGLSNLQSYDTTNNEWMLKAGDLAGLVNLETLALSAQGETLPSGLLTGVGVNVLNLSNVVLEPGSFNGMLSIRKLKYHGAALPPLHADAIASLEHLHVTFAGPPPSLTGDELIKATNLQTIVLAASLKSWNTDQLQMHIPSDLFKNNHSLQSIKLGFYDGHFFSGLGGAVIAQPALLANLVDLETLYISRLRLTDHQPGQPPFDLPPESPLAQYLDVPNATLLEYERQYTDIKKWLTWTTEQGLVLSIHYDTQGLGHSAVN